MRFARWEGQARNAEGCAVAARLDAAGMWGEDIAVCTHAGRRRLVACAAWRWWEWERCVCGGGCVTTGQALLLAVDQHLLKLLRQPPLALALQVHICGGTRGLASTEEAQLNLIARIAEVSRRRRLGQSFDHRPTTAPDTFFVLVTAPPMTPFAPTLLTTAPQQQILLSLTTACSSASTSSGALNPSE